MKKYRYTVLAFVISAHCLFAQQAQDYFPLETGATWSFKEVPLDSLNNPIDSLTVYSIDSFAVKGVYQGQNTNFILSKTGLKETVYYQPYIDTTHINLDGSNASLFFRVPSVDDLIGSFDTTGYGQFISTFMAFYDLLKSFEKWYPLYKFTSPINQEYVVFQFDTTVVIDSMSLPLRFQLKEKRMNDEIIFLEIGNFDCKKFQQTLSIMYYNQVLPPPFPPIVITLLSRIETIWFAPQNWIVRSEIPTSEVDLSMAGAGKYYIPGLISELTLPIVTSVEDNLKDYDFNLNQNYPNPFNPSTKINYEIQKAGHVSLKVFDIIGNEVAELVNNNVEAGKYQVEFNAKHLSSGVYFYKLETGGKQSIKKLVILK